MSDKRVVDVILHCQKQIKKENLPDEKLLHYLGRLARLRITVPDLAETGIGRTVNSLSRNEGQVGQAAETLVRGWKQMVSEQQNQAEAERESEEESDSNSGSSDDDEDDNTPYEIPEHVHEDNSIEPFQNGIVAGPPGNSSNRNEDFPDVDDEDDDIDDPYMDGGFLNLNNVHTDEEDEEEEEENEHDYDSDASDRLRIADDGQNLLQNEDFKINPYIKQEPDVDPVDSLLPERMKEHKSSSNSSSKSSHHQSSSSSKSHHHERSSKGHSSKSKEHTRDHSTKESSKEHKHKESKDHRSSKHDDHKSENRSRHHHSSKSHHEKDKSSSKDKHRSSKDSSTNREAKYDKDRSKDKKETQSVDHRSSSNSSSHHHKDKSRENFSLKSSSPDRKKSELKEDRKRKDTSDNGTSSKKSKLVIKEEIDSTSGVNFSDVLGSLDVPSSSSSLKLKKVKKEEHEKSADKHESRKKKHESSKHASSSKHSRERDGSEKKTPEKDSEGAKMSKKSFPGKIEGVIKPIVNISPNYKPINPPLPSFSRSTNGSSAALSLSHAELSDLGPIDYVDNDEKDCAEISQEDAISTMLSNRNVRSKVFSGVKSSRRGAVPTLFDLCMQVLKDNIGDLGWTGGIPYDILKPALERANPEQLMSIEAQNDHLIGETDELWQFHCKRDFRGKVPEETESWRELYERCKEGQQQKFELIKKKMKMKMIKQEIAEPVRKTKLAYVDTTSGPRFNREKANTIKNGMKTLKIKEEKGVKRGVCSSASVGFNNPKVSGDPTKVIVQEASVIIAPDSRSGHAPAPPVSRESSAAKLKPKKAPLMQKTMKLIRSLNRR